MTLVFLADPLKSQEEIFDLEGVKSIGEVKLSVSISRQLSAASESRLKHSSLSLNLSQLG